MTLTDELLMVAVRGGDLAKLGMLFERHHEAVFDFLSRMTGDRAAAEDLVQDVFVRILKYRATYQDGASFQTWLFRIARNARADYFRQRHGTEHVPAEDLDLPSPALGPAHGLERRRDIERLQRALLLLRDDKRELIVLARYRAMTHEAIGDLIGVEPGTVKVRLHRAVKELRDIFLRLSENPSCAVTTSTHTSPTF